LSPDLRLYPVQAFASFGGDHTDPLPQKYCNTSYDVRAGPMRCAVTVTNGHTQKRKRGVLVVQHMDILNHLVVTADPVGLIAYVTIMAIFLGSTALASHRDRVRERIVAIRRSKLRSG
jgi:hypothetical protein